MREEILLLIKKLHKKEEKVPFKKPILLNFLEIEEIVKAFHSENRNLLWDEIVSIFEKIKNLKEKNQKNSS
ncbi:MAG: hypothetical protein ABIK77_01525 [candidate division WOR-3 bacterium]